MSEWATVKRSDLAGGIEEEEVSNGYLQATREKDQIRCLLSFFVEKKENNVALEKESLPESFTFKRMPFLTT